MKLTLDTIEDEKKLKLMLKELEIKNFLHGKKLSKCINL